MPVLACQPFATLDDVLASPLGCSYTEADDGGPEDDDGGHGSPFEDFGGGSGIGDDYDGPDLGDFDDDGGQWAGDGNGPHGGGHSSDDQFGVGAIPEPATWLSMIIGFGLIGSLLRRARRWTLVG